MGTSKTHTPLLKASCITKKSNRKVLWSKDEYRIEKCELKLNSTSAHGKTNQTTVDNTESDPTANLTFNLRLTDSEKTARDDLSLPYLLDAEKKTGLLVKNHRESSTSGEIHYQPDDADDYDDEAPDDDLDI